MPSKKNRLAKDREIQRVFKQGGSFFNPFFSLKYLKIRGATIPRFAVVVSTKVQKKATVRNRLKRIVRETIRLNLGKIPPGDYVLILKPKAAEAEEKILLGSLKQLLKI